MDRQTYSGKYQRGQCSVTVNDKPLPPRFDLRNHSPDGYAWGYSGSGPAQLSLALLAHALQDDARAQTLYQRFKERVIARIEKDQEWLLTDEDIRRHADLIEVDAGKPSALNPAAAWPFPGGR